MQGIQGMDREVRKSIWKNLRCSDVEQLVDSYLDGEMSEGTEWRFQAHLARCEKCRELVDDFQSLVATARTLAEKPIDPGVQRRLREALLKEVGFESEDLPEEKPALKVIK